MKKKITYSLIFVLCFYLVTAFVYAENTQDKLNDVNSKLSNVKKQLKEGKKQESALSAEIQKLESQIYSSERKANSLASDISLTQSQINQKLAELSALETQMTEQNQNLNARLRNMYESGSIGFIDVLLGSKGINDLMTNLDRVQLIYENDVKVMEELKAQHAVIDGTKKQLLALQQSLQSQQNQAKSMATELSEDRSVVASKKAEIANNNKLLEAQERAFLAEANRLAAEILALQSKGTTYSGGSMAWPVPGRSKISSPFGNRIDPITGRINTFHTGIDIPAPAGTPVIAANDGTVIYAGWKGAYGNAVFIDHGGGIVTVYAHNSSISVSKGQTVSRGQQISGVGTTGNSTGNHLHFEVRKNGQYQNPRAGWV